MTPAGAGFALGTVWGAVVAAVSFWAAGGFYGARPRWRRSGLVVLVLGLLGGLLGGLVSAWLS